MYAISRVSQFRNRNVGIFLPEIFVVAFSFRGIIILNSFEAFEVIFLRFLSWRYYIAETVTCKLTYQSLLISSLAMVFSDTDKEDQAGNNMHLKDTVEVIEISDSSVRRLIKTKGIKQFKRLKTPYIIYATRARRVERANNILEKFSKNNQMIEGVDFRDESGFSLQIPINI